MRLRGFVLKKHKIYDLDIHPLVERITLVCKQENIPGFMLFQDIESEFRVSSCNMNTEMAQMIVQYLFDAIKNKPSAYETILTGIVDHLSEEIKRQNGKIGSEFDNLISDMITLGQIQGHSSLFLDSLGIPRIPPSKQEKAENGAVDSDVTL